MTQENALRSSLQSLSDISQDLQPLPPGQPTRQQLLAALQFMKKQYQSLNRQYFQMKDKLDQTPPQPPTSALRGSDNFELQNEIFQLKSQVARLKVSSMEEVKKIQMKHGREKEALHAEFEIRLRQAKDSYNKELKGIEQMLNQRNLQQQEIIQQQQEKLAEFLAEIQRLEATGHTLEKENFDLKIKVGELEKSKISGKVGSKIEEIERDSQISRIRDQNSKLQQKVHDLLEENNTMRKELQTLQLQRQRKSIESERLKVAQVEKLRKSIGNDQQQIQRLKSQLKSVNSQYDACKQLLMSKQVQLLALKDNLSVKDQQLLKMRKSDSSNKVEAHRQYIQQMADHIRRLNENIKEVEKNAEDDKSKLSAEILRLKKIVTDKEGEIIVLRERRGTENMELQRRYDGKVAECEMLAASLKAKVGELQEINDKAALQEKILRSDVSRKIELQAENLVGEQHIRLKDQQLKTLASELQHKTTANQHLQSQYDRLRQAFQQSLQRQQLLKQSHPPVAQVSTPTPQYLKLIQDTSKLNQQLTEQLQRCYSQIQELQRGSDQRSIIRNNINEQRQEQIRKLEKELLKAQKELMEVQIQTKMLSDQKKFVEGNVENLRREKEEWRERAGRVQELEGEVAEKHNLTEVLSGDIANLQNRLSQAQQTLTSRTEAAGKLKEQLNEKGVEIVRLNQTILEKDGDISRLKEVCADLQNANAEKNQLSQQRIMLLGKINELTEQITQKSMSESRNQAQATLQNQELQLGHLNGILQHMQQDLEKKQTQNTNLRNQVERLHNQVKIIHRQSTQKEKEIARLIQEDTTKQAEIQRLKQMIGATESHARFQIQATHQQNTKLHNQINQLNEAIRQYEDLGNARVQIANSQLTDELAHLNSIVAETQLKLHQQSLQNQRLRLLITQTQQQNHSIMSAQMQTSNLSIRSSSRPAPPVIQMQTSTLQILYQDAQTSHISQPPNHEVQALKLIIAQQQQYLRECDEVRQQNRRYKAQFSQFNSEAQIIVRQNQTKAVQAQAAMQKMAIELAELSVWNQQLQDQSTTYKQQRDGYLKDKQALARELDERRDEGIQLEVRGREMRQLVDRLKEENEQLKKQKFEQDRQSISRREQSEGRSGAHISRLELEVQKHLEMIDRLKNELTRAKDRILTLDESVRENEKNAELDRERFQLLKADKGKADRQAKTLEASLRIANEEKQDLTRKAGKFDEDLKKYREQLANRKGDYQRLMNQYERLRQKNQMQVQTLQQNMAQMTMLLQKQKQQFDQKNRQKFQQQTAYFSRLNEATVKLEQDLRRLREQQRRHRDQIGLVNKQKAEMFSQLAKTREENSNLIQQIEEKDIAIANVQARLEELSREMNRMRQSGVGVGGSLNYSLEAPGVSEYVNQLEEKCRMLEELTGQLQRDNEMKSRSRIVFDGGVLRGAEQGLRAENAALLNKINELTNMIQGLQLQNNDLNINFERYKRTSNKQYFDARSSQGTSSRGLYSQLQRLNAMLIAKDQQLALLRSTHSRVSLPVAQPIPVAQMAQVQFSQPQAQSIRVDRLVEPSVHSPLKFHTLMPVSESSTRISPPKSTEYIRVMQESNVNPESSARKRTGASPVRYGMSSSRNLRYTEPDHIQPF